MNFTYEIIADREAAEVYKNQVQTILDANRGSYSAAPWVKINVETVFDGTFAVPIPEGAEVESLGNRVVEKPVDPSTIIPEEV
jgi:hypothetical protein